MKTEGEALLLRVFVNESDRWQGRPLYEAIIRAAKEKGLAGATALRGIEGFGVSGRVHSVKVLHLSEDVPIVIEIIDSAEQIAVFLPVLDSLVGEGTVTIEKIHRILYRRDGNPTEGDFEDEIGLDVPEPAPPAPAVVEVADPFADFTDRAHQIIVDAREASRKSRRTFVDSIDILVAMLDESRGIAATALRTLGIDRRQLERALKEVVSRDEMGAPYLNNLIAKSKAAAKWLEDEYTGAEHLFLGLCQLRPSAATDILSRLGAQPRDICQEIFNAIGHDGDWQGWMADHPDL